MIKITSVCAVTDREFVDIGGPKVAQGRPGRAPGAPTEALGGPGKAQGGPTPSNDVWFSDNFPLRGASRNFQEFCAGLTGS
eukprot:11596018-Karenia_brevis.AAC.1